APARVVAVALPADQVGGLNHHEAERRIDLVDQHRHQHAAVLADGRLLFDPGRGDRGVRPDREHYAGGIELLVGRAGPLRAGPGAVIPPDIEAVGTQRLDHADHASGVFLLVGDEDVRHAPRARRPGAIPAPGPGRL